MMLLVNLSVNQKAKPTPLMERRNRQNQNHQKIMMDIITNIRQHLHFLKIISKEKYIDEKNNNSTLII